MPRITTSLGTPAWISTPGACRRCRKIKAQILGSLKGHLVAWDPIANKEVWRAELGHPWNGGVVATAGNLVFQGTAMGAFVAYRADTGEKVCRLKRRRECSRRRSVMKSTASSMSPSKSVGAAPLGWPRASSR